MSPGAHALLSASSAARWLHCTAAPHAEAKYPDTTSPYAEEGTVAHSLAEVTLLKLLRQASARECNKRIKAVQSDPHYNAEMQVAVDEYIAAVQHIILQHDKPVVMVEKRLDLSGLVPEGFGTADCIVVSGAALDVIDLKFGKGVAVNAENNPQLRLYAWGALQIFNWLFAPKTVTTHIVQPRLQHISSESLLPAELNAWADSIVRPAAAEAFQGPGKFEGGDWCQFCRARSLCRARSAFAEELTEAEPTLPPELSDADVARILERADFITKWISDVQAYALQALMDGKEIPGFKLVEGRSNRVITDADGLAKTLTAAGTDEALLYERRMLTLTKLETLIGRKKFSELAAPFVDKPPGKPTVVPASDKRPPFSSAQSAFAANINPQTKED